MPSAETPPRFGSPKSSSPSRVEDNATTNVPESQRSNALNRRSLLPQHTPSRPGPNVTGDLPRPNAASSASSRFGLPTTNITRTGSVVKPQSSGIPTPRSKDVRNTDGGGTMPPPPLFGRSQSLRKPATQASEGIKPESSLLKHSLSTRRTESMAPRAITKPQTPANVTNSALHRTASSRIPGSTSSTPQSEQRPPHGRARSITTVPAAQRTVPGLTRTSTVSKTHMRSKSMVTGQAPTNEPKAAPLAKPSLPTNDPIKPTNTRGVLAAPQSANPARPAFSTLQQHFSPAKVTTKPPLPSSSLTPSSEERLAAMGTSFEASKLQSELLYLSILHQNAEASLRQYENSGHAALKKDFEALKEDQKQVREAEQLYQEVINLSALAEWTGISGAGGKGLQDLPETVRCLSSCVQEVALMSEPGSRYSNLIQEFTKWIEHADAIYNGRDGGPGGLFVDALPQEWHETHASISQRLRLLERKMEGLPPTLHDPSTKFADSALARILRVLGSMTSGMRKELDLLVNLESQVLSREAQRVEDAIARLDLPHITERAMQPVAWH